MTTAPRKRLADLVLGSRSQGCPWPVSLQFDGQTERVTVVGSAREQTEAWRRTYTRDEVVEALIQWEEGRQ